MVGNTYTVLVEGVSKKSDEHHFGRNSQNTIIVFPKGDSKIGTYRKVKALSNTAVTLIGELLETESE
jgi:tRNA-2-methylthio-N6-dimethylallyladenosine synthase